MRKIIGKIQLIIGVILLIAGVISIVLSINYMGTLSEDTERSLDEQLDNIKSELKNNDTQIIVAQNLINNLYINKFGIFNLYSSTLFSSSIVIMISLLFITQGIVNLSEKKL